MLAESNPQSESEIMKSFEDATKHPDMWLLLKTQELGILKRRWLDLPRQEGRAELFFQMVKDHIEMAERCMYLLREERETQRKLVKQSLRNA